MCDGAEASRSRAWHLTALAPLWGGQNREFFPIFTIFGSGFSISPLVLNTEGGVRDTPVQRMLEEEEVERGEERGDFPPGGAR